MKRLSMAVLILLSSVAMAAEVQMDAGEQNKSNMGGQIFAQAVYIQTADQNMMRDISQMIDKINEMMKSMSDDMKKMKSTDNEKMKDMSKTMSTMSEIIKDLSWYMDKGEMTEAMTKKMQEKISDLGSTMNKTQKKQE